MLEGSRSLPPRARRLLWFDAGAGAVAGALVLGLHEWLAALYGFPVVLVVFTGTVNLLYASYSGTLALRNARGRPPSRAAINVLIAGNAGWLFVCLAIAGVLDEATHLGIALLVAEGLFVGILAAVEYAVIRPHTADA